MNRRRSKEVDSSKGTSDKGNGGRKLSTKTLLFSFQKIKESKVPYKKISQDAEEANDLIIQI